MKSLIIIPARFNSTRFPGKPLIDLKGKTMIQRVWESCKKSNATEVLVATDNDKIYNEVLKFGKVVMTSEDCNSGTERVIEASLNFSEYDIIINVQGDEPFIDHNDINKLIKSIQKNPKYIHTFITKLSRSEFRDRNVVKCIVKDKKIVMFTRSSIYDNFDSIFKHIGIYGFSKKIIKKISNLKIKTENELNENLEQLRWMDNDFEMYSLYTPKHSIGIDVPNDYKNALNFLNKI